MLTADGIDNDAIPDYLDVDAEGDGTLDIVEGGATSVGNVDRDSNGALDVMSGSDGYGNPDVIDIDVVSGLDTNGDGYVDLADIDVAGGVETDGDGVDDEGELDASGDGVADLFADVAQVLSPPDVHSNNIPDVDQVADSVVTTTNVVYRTGQQCGRSSASYGFDATDCMLPVLSLFASLGIFMRPRRVLTCAVKSPRVSAMVLLGAAFSTWNLTSVDSLQAAELDAAQSNSDQSRLAAEPVLHDESFQRRYYLGLGLGRSWLEPDTSDVEGVDPEERVDLGGQITLGTDVLRWLSLELHAAALGDAELSNGDSIGYNEVGVSALLYAGGARNRFNRQGFTGFGRVGIGGLINTSDIDSEASLEQVNPAHLAVGLGVEYATRIGLGIRAEGLLFDEDVNYMQLGLLYRFGRRQQIAGDEVVAQGPLDGPDQRIAIPEPVATPSPVASPAPIEVLDFVDNDDDGIDDTMDQCLDTAVGLAVDEAGCAIYNGAIEGLSFPTGSAALTFEARRVLDDVANTLKSLPEMMFKLVSHTDSVGDQEMNLALSVQRVRAVAGYLVRKGIPVSRFTARAFGEARPIASNNTAEGRRMNRRVELTVTR